jgi:hypothetical protein
MAQWDGNWETDNFGGMTQSKYPIDTGSGQKPPQKTADKLIVSYDSDKALPYVRLCDLVARVKAEYPEAGLAQIEKAYLSKRLLKANRSFEVNVEFDISDFSEGFRFVQASQAVEASCIRWNKPGQQPDPVQNPADRPATLPHQRCNPETDSKGCGNTCKSGFTRASCENENDPWGSAKALW